MHSCIHSFIYLIFSFKTKNHKPIIDSTRVNSAPTWVRDSTGRLVKVQDTPIPEEIAEEVRITVEMSERPGSENQDVETSETRYTRAEVDVMIGEVLAAKLIELGYTPTTQAQPPVASPVLMFDFGFLPKDGDKIFLDARAELVGLKNDFRVATRFRDTNFNF